MRISDWSSDVCSSDLGLKASGRHDLFLAELAPGSTVAGVFTRSRFAGAPVLWCRKALPQGRVRALVVNSGNSNAITGLAGDRTVEHTVEAAAKLFGCSTHEVFVASTGIIGQPMPPAQSSRNRPTVYRKTVVQGK